MLVLKISFENPQNWNYDQHILQWIFHRLIDDKYHWFEIWLFTFSNIYPYEKGSFYRNDKIYEIKVKSVSDAILKQIGLKLMELKKVDFNHKNIIFIKKAFFVEDILPCEGKILKWITPIVLSLNREIAYKYNIKFTLKKDVPLYWNKNMWFKVFVRQFHKNIIKKYIVFLESLIWGRISLEELSPQIRFLFNNLEDWEKNLLNLFKDKENFDNFIENVNFFDGYKFKRGALVPYKGWKIAGSVWDFKVTNKNDDTIDIFKILKTISLMGFWEKTTAWFGFMM